MSREKYVQEETNLCWCNCGPVCTLVCNPVSQNTGTDCNVDWRYYGNDPGNQRYQNVDQINLANVSSLKPAWIFHTGVLDDDRVSFEVSPLVINGVMYITTGHDDVFALKPLPGMRSGPIIRWRKCRLLTSSAYVADGIIAASLTAMARYSSAGSMMSSSRSTPLPVRSSGKGPSWTGATATPSQWRLSL